MNLEEAKAWLRGERSHTNLVHRGINPDWQAIVALADAGSVQQAYWVVRAHSEGLMEGDPDGD